MKPLQAAGLLSQPKKGLKDVRNEFSEAVEVPADTLATLIEQTNLFWGQASLSILHTRCLNNLKMPLKDPSKVKILPESESHQSGKTFQSHTIKTERSKKQSGSF